MQTLLVVVIWPFRSHPRERRSLGAVYQTLAALADAVAGGERLAPGATTIDDARAVLADRQPFGNTREEAILQSLLDEAERIRNPTCSDARADSSTCADLPTIDRWGCHSGDGPHISPHAHRRPGETAGSRACARPRSLVPRFPMGPCCAS
jgi:hypothetical protein